MSDKWISLRWMPLDVTDWDEDTRGLTCAQDGAYGRLIRHYWRKGPLPDDNEELAQIVGMTSADWSKARAKLHRFFAIEGGLWRQARVEAEHEKAMRIVGTSQANGKSGGRPKKTQQKPGGLSPGYENPPENADSENPVITRQQTPLPIPRDSNPDGLEIGGVVTRARETDWPSGDVAGQLILTVASPWLDPQKSHGLITTAGRLEAWRRDGASWLRVVVPVVSGLCEGRQSAIASWKFFDNAIAMGIASERDGLTIPQGKTNGHGTAAQRAYDERQANYARAFASPVTRPD